MPQKSKPAPPQLPPLYKIRNQTVVLDSDLAKLYGVETKVFNQAITRNADRFPHDFVFRLERHEFTNLKSQIVTSSSSHGGVRKLPRVFTEHGALMAATVLRSKQAVAMSVYLVRAFVAMREELATNAKILHRIEKIDRKLLEHDYVLQDVVEKLIPLLNPPMDSSPKRRIGFGSDDS